MGSRTIWVREADEVLWQRAESYAKARRISMSTLVAVALERLLDEGNVDVGIDPRG